MFYKVVNYFDVWNDPDGGYTVNNSCVVHDNFFIADSDSNKRICTRLLNAGFLASDDMRRLSVVDDGSMIEIQTRGGFPLFGLVPNN